MHLLAFVSLSTLIFTGVTQSKSTSNDKICQVNSDPNTCTVTVVFQDIHAPPPGNNGAGELSTFAYVLDHECNSIIDSEDCSDDSGDTQLCKQDIPKEDDTATLPVKGTDNTVFVDGSGDGEKLHNYTPIFTVNFGSNPSVNDHEDSGDPCTCAQSVSGLTKAQVCSCWVDCSN